LLSKVKIKRRIFQKHSKYTKDTEAEPSQINSLLIVIDASMKIF